MHKTLRAVWETKGKSRIELIELSTNPRRSYFLEIFISGRKYSPIASNCIGNVHTIKSAIDKTEEIALPIFKTYCKSVKSVKVFCPACGNIHSDGTYGNC